MYAGRSFHTDTTECLKARLAKTVRVRETENSHVCERLFNVFLLSFWMAPCSTGTSRLSVKTDRQTHRQKDRQTENNMHQLSLAMMIGDDLEERLFMMWMLDKRQEMYEVLCHTTKYLLLVVSIALPRVLKDPPEQILHHKPLHRAATCSQRPTRTNPSPQTTTSSCSVRPSVHQWYFCQMKLKINHNTEFLIENWI